jgi:hypothetical protein
MTVNRERKMVGKEMTTLSFAYCTLGDVLKQVQGYVEAYGADAYIDRHCYAYEDQEYDFVMMKVPETDKEMATRIAQEEQWDKDCQERDKANYERLSKIYGEKK